MFIPEATRATPENLDFRGFMKQTIGLYESPDLMRDVPALAIKSEEAFIRDEAHALRAGVHELLGSLLAQPPDERMLTRLRGIGDVDASDGPLAMGWQLLKAAAEAADAEALRHEYTALFIGVGRGELVPYASWYQTGFLMEKPLAVLRQDLAQHGIERQDGIAESEDHIAAVSDAMALIIRAGDEIPFVTQRSFFEAHLAPWAGRFFDDLQEASSADFYRSVGFFGSSFMAVERQVLGLND